MWVFSSDIKGVLCHGQNNVPTEYVCKCFDELGDMDVLHLSVLTCYLALSLLRPAICMLIVLTRHRTVANCHLLI